jgi:hypothetical protein
MWRWIWTVELWSCPGWRLPSEVRTSWSAGERERDYMPNNGNLLPGAEQIVQNSLMACGKYESLYNDLLDCGAWNLSYDCCMFCSRWYVIQVIYTIRYIMTKRTLLHLTSSGVKFYCFTAGSSVITRGETNNLALDCLDLADPLILSSAPICKCVFQRCSHKCRIAFIGLWCLLGNDRCFCLRRTRCCVTSASFYWCVRPS